MSSRFIMPFADVGSGIKPSSGAKLFFFELDGVTPKNTFSDQLSTPTANDNPVISDSLGVFGDIYITGSYKITLQNKNGTQSFGAVIIEEVGQAANINNLKLPEIFLNLSDMTSSAVVFPVNKMLQVSSLNTEYLVTAGASPRAESPGLTTGFHAAFIKQTFVSNDQISGTQDTRGLGVVGCAVRITSGGEGVDNTFALIDDTQHDPINSTSVTGGLQTISVFHEQPFSDVVGSCVVVPDETLAQRGIMCGGSIAANQSIVTMTKRHQFTIDWAAGAAAIADLVVDPFMDSTRYVTTDNTGGNGSYQIIMPRTLDGNRIISPLNRISPDVYINTLSDTTADFFPYKSITINCAYNGSVWAVTAPQSLLTTALAAIGVTCSNVGNLITVAHPPTLGTSSNALITAGPASNYFYGNVYAETTTSTTVTLADNTGVPQTPVNGDSFNIKLEDILWKYGFSIVDIGVIKLSPTLDFKDISTANNFWLLGNHWALRSS